MGQGAGVGDTPGSARKRLRIYVFSEHYNQKAGRTFRSDSAPTVPPSWALRIHGRLVDPDSTHPGGGGDPEPPDTAHVPRHHFSWYLKRIDVELTPSDPVHAKESGMTRLIVWDKMRSDRESRDSFDVKRVGVAPMNATVKIHVDHQPELWQVEAELESLLGLPTGEGGITGLYSMAYVVQRLWHYATQKGLKVPEEQQRTGDVGEIEQSEPKIRLDGPLRSALGLKESMEPTVLDAGTLQEALKILLKPPSPVVITYTIDPTSGVARGDVCCVDAHVEVPLGLEGAEIPTALSADLAQLDQEIEQLDQSLAVVVARYREHRRRHDILAGFASDPVGVIREIIMAHGKELRFAPGKEGESAEISRPGEVYGDAWTADAVMKYLARKSSAAGATAAAVQPNALAVQMLQQQYQAASLVMQAQFAAAAAAAQQAGAGTANGAQPGAQAAAPPQ